MLKKAPDRRQEFLNDNKGQNSLLLGNHKTNQRFLSLRPQSDEIKILSLGWINVEKKKGTNTFLKEN